MQKFSNQSIITSNFAKSNSSFNENFERSFSLSDETISSDTNERSTYVQKVTLSHTQKLIFENQTLTESNSAHSFTEKNSSSNSHTFSFKKRCLILSHSRESSFNSLELREKLNQNFKKQLNTDKSVLAAITRSQRNENIILTTTETFSSEILLQYQTIWENYFNFSSTFQDKNWFKVIAHTVPTEIFNFEKGLQLFQQELETFNGFYLLNVYWLSSKEKRDQNKHGSIVMSFDSQKTATKILSQRIFIAGMPIRTAKYEEMKKLNEQCQKCQKFNHESSSCKNKSVCQICAENHITRLHRCSICSVIGSTCTHTVLKCANCSRNHRANSTECEFKISKQSNQDSINEQKQSSC